SIDAATRKLRLVSRGGQDLLKDALRHYYEAKFEPNLKRRAELMLFANANIGMHEQTRLQTYIAGSLNAPIANTLIDSTHDALAQRNEPLWGIRKLQDGAEDLLERFGIEPQIAIGTGADDWVSLDQRMRFILELFRSRQQNQRLLAPIFTASQVDTLKQGKI